MIKELFLPEKLGDKRIYSQRIISFAIQEETVYCSQVYAKSSKIIIEKLFEQKLSDNKQDSFFQRASIAIKSILDKISKYDQIRISIPTNLIIFKELEVPFKDPEKIRLILDYEIEPLLPFSIQEAVVDFIITKQALKEQNSNILAAVIRKTDLQEYLNLYKNINLEPTAITIDLFGYYSLYQEIPDYTKISSACALVELNSDSTRVSYLENGQLKLTRLIDKNILSISKQMSQELNLQENIIEQKILESGFRTIKDENFDKSLKNNAINFFNEIQFTLNSFSLKLNSYQAISKIIFTGTYSNIKDLAYFSHNLLQISCETLTLEKILSNKKIKTDIKDFKNINNLYLVSLGTAIVSNQQKDFDLRRKEFQLPATSLFNKQLLTSFLLIILIFSIIFGLGFLQINSLSNEISSIEQREILKLKPIIPKDSKFNKNSKLAGYLKEAEKITNLKMDQWAPFLKAKLNALAILQELTNIADKRRFDVSIKEINIYQQESTNYTEISGLFRSKTGTNHFEHWAELQKRFTESDYLTVENVDEKLADENKGVEFSVKLKEKDFESTES